MAKSGRNCGEKDKRIAAHGGDINGICSSLSPLDGPLGSECYQKKIWKWYQHFEFLQINENAIIISYHWNYTFLFVSVDNQTILNSFQSWSNWSGHFAVSCKYESIKALKYQNTKVSKYQSILNILNSTFTLSKYMCLTFVICASK